MSRLDQHVAAVRRKLALGVFVDALAWGGVALAGVAVVAIVLRHALVWPVPTMLLWVGLGAVVVGAAAWAMWRRPGAYEAAVAIDRKLSIKDKFATALYARGLGHPMAQAAVRDAETTADSVRLRGKFGLHFPRPVYGVALLAVLAALAQWYTPRDVFGHKAQEQKKQAEVARVQQAQQQIAAARIKVEQAIPLELAKGSDEIKRIEQDLERLQNTKDPVKAKNRLIESLEAMDKALSKEIEKNQKFADAQNQSKAFNNLKIDPNDKSTVAEASRDISKGDFQEAMKKIEQASKEFEKQPPEQQKKSAEQMGALAKQLADMAKDPAVQEQIKKMAEKSLGADPQQAGELAKAIQKAAGGDDKAAQQVKEMPEKLQQQMNNGQGPTEEQKQALDGLMKQMQAAANTQSQAQRLSDAAKKMAGAMQQNSGGSNPQQMSDAAKAMSDALGQMQAVQADAQQMAAARDAVQQQMRQASQGMGEGSQDSAGNGASPGDGSQGDSAMAGAGLGSGQGQSNSNGNGTGQGTGQSNAGSVGRWSSGNPQGQGNGTGGPGQGSASGIGKQVAPFKTQAAFSQAQDNEKGRNLAAVYVDADTIKGESKQALRDVAVSQQRMETDEVDLTHIDPRSQDAIQKYFAALKQDAENKP